MSKFKKTLAQVEELGLRVGGLEEKLETATDGREELKLAELLAKEAGVLAPGIAKSVRIAKETDDDKKLYGPGMVKQVLELDAAFQAVSDRLKEARLSAEARANPLLQAEREAEQARLALEQRERQKAENARDKRDRDEEEARVTRAREKKEALERAEQEKKEQAEQERAVYDSEMTGVSARQQRLAKAAADNITLDAALALLKNNTTAAEFTKAVKIMAQIMHDVSESPDNDDLRSIRIKNSDFQDDIAQHLGGEESLYALGFRLVEVTKNASKVTNWFLPEASMEDLDKWEEWF